MLPSTFWLHADLLERTAVLGLVDPDAIFGALLCCLDSDPAAGLQANLDTLSQAFRSLEAIAEQFRLEAPAGASLQLLEHQVGRGTVRRARDKSRGRQQSAAGGRGHDGRPRDDDEFDLDIFDQIEGGDGEQVLVEEQSLLLSQHLEQGDDDVDFDQFLENTRFEETGECGFGGDSGGTRGLELLLGLASDGDDGRAAADAQELDFGDRSGFSSDSTEDEENDVEEQGGDRKSSGVTFGGVTELKGGAWEGMAERGNQKTKTTLRSTFTRI